MEPISTTFLAVELAVGIVGDTLATVGYDYGLEGPVRAALKRLRDLVKSAVTEGNHDLLRALRTGQS
jgi:hypothetical protein